MNNKIISLFRRYKNYNPNGILLQLNRHVDFALIAPHVRLGDFKVFVRAVNSANNNNLPWVALYYNFHIGDSRNREFAICNGDFREYSEYIIPFGFDSLYSKVL